MTQLFALVDCNNFYVSCERVFDATPRGRPVVVLSNNDGCIVARSNEAKALGIKMGEPWHIRHRFFKAQGVIRRSSNYTLYGDMSARVMGVLSRFTPDLEVYSIDEAFLGLDDFQDLENYVQQMRSTVMQWTGIPVSIGIGRTKTLAKIANHCAKKNLLPTHPAEGICWLQSSDHETQALEVLELSDIWGVGRRMVSNYAELGITTPLNLRAADPKALRHRFSVVVERLVRELRGEPCLELETVTPPPNSRSWSHDPSASSSPTLKT